MACSSKICNQWEKEWFFFFWELPGSGTWNREVQNGRWRSFIIWIVRTDLNKKKSVFYGVIFPFTYTSSWGYFAESSEQRIGTSPSRVATQAEPQTFNCCKQYPP